MNVGKGRVDNHPGAPRRHCCELAGSGIGVLLSAIHGFDTGIPYVQKHVKGLKWLPLIIGLPPFLIYSGASAAFGGYALPRLTQLSVTSYYAGSSASSYFISLLTRQIEDAKAFPLSTRKTRMIRLFWYMTWVVAGARNSFQFCDVLPFAWNRILV